MYALFRKIRTKGYEGRSSLSKSKKDLNKLIKIGKQNEKSISKRFALRLLIVLGKRFIAREQYPLAKTCFREALAFASPEKYDATLFLYLWPDLLNEDYKSANKAIDEFKLHGKFDDLEKRLQFWIAYASEMEGKEKLAQYYYNKILEQSPLSYYSIMANKRLHGLLGKEKKNWISSFMARRENDRRPLSHSEYSTLLNRALKRIKIFALLELEEFLGHEGEKISKTPIKELLRHHAMYSQIQNQELKEKITLHVASILAEGKNYLKSFSLIYEGMKEDNFSVNLFVLKTLFPAPYFNRIKSLAHNKKIDPYIILSLIRQESAFNPRATSSAGAKGLMQLMLPTARQTHRRVSSKSLERPKTNLSIGIRHFAKLYKRFDKNLIYTLAAYNAGAHRVKRWKKQYFRNDKILHLIESIPFDETNLYVKLIFRNIFFYKLLDGHLQDPGNVNKIFDVLIAKH